MLCPLPSRCCGSVLLVAAGILFTVAGAGAAEDLQNSVGMTFRLIDAGSYERGERDARRGFTKDHSSFNTEGDESPPHPVVLTRPFYLATTEVTVAQFRRFVEATAYRTTAESDSRGAVGWDPRSPADRPRYVATFRDGDEFDWQHPGFEQAAEHAVVCVSFTDAKAFCQWLSEQEGLTYRLPTEAEWEYAARAGTKTYFSFGDSYRGTIQRFANIGNVELEQAFPDRVRRQWLVDVVRDPADKHVFTAPVGSYESNPWGIFDLYGNVWEWCEDRYLDTAYAAFERAGYQQVRKRAINPLNEKSWSDAGDWRVIRGGSWFNSPIQCRSSVRGYFEANEAACYIGFRVVRQAAPGQIAAAERAFAQSEAARATLERLADRVQERRDGRLTIELSQRRTQLTDEFLNALQAFREPIDVHLEGQGNLTAVHVEGLLKTPELRGLIVSNAGPGVIDADFAALSQHPQLELLQLTGAPRLSDALLVPLQKLEQLELLHFDSPQITDDGLQSLGPLQRLRSLRLSGTASGGLALSRFRGSPLETFACDHLTDEAAELLGEFPTVREVTIAGSPISKRGLAAITRLPQLQQLDLSGCAALHDADFAVLAEAYELTHLRLQGTAAGDQAAAGLLRLNNLRELQIGSELLTDAGLRQLCGIVSLRNFRIAPEATRVTDAGLTDLWRLVNLHSLGIAAPGVTGSGLATLHELSELEWLGLQGTGVADVACANVAKSESLQQLIIGSWEQGGPTALSDEGLQRLANARGLKQFELLRRGTQVTEAGVAELRERHPQLNVHAH